MAATSAGLAIAPRVLDWRAAAAASTSASLLPFVQYYKTNVSADLSFSTNAAVEILSGFSSLWQTGTAWNDGTVLDAEALRANMVHSVWVTQTRTSGQAKESFIVDRQDQSYDMIGALGPLAPYYYTGSAAVTSITSAPDGTPSATISDSGNGAGSASSALGPVVSLVTTLRGNYSSANPSKNTFQHPRPWRMNDDSEVIDTGTVDAFGFPVYKSDVVVAPQLLLQRSLTPASDGGFPSGHTNAFYLAGLAYAYAVPERFQEIIVRAMERANYRIVAGMHSSVDVIGGRILGTALAAAILNDPANAATKANARTTALAYFSSITGASNLFDYAHSAGLDSDPYASRSRNERLIAPWWTYVLPRHSGDVESGDVESGAVAMVVPVGAEVLLETRLPYLDAVARREVLRTTALPSGHPLIDGPELWGRLNLFAAADGYGAFSSDVVVVMDASAGGFSAADSWKNDISGSGGLVKQGSGSLTLCGANAYRGGTVITGGTLVAASSRALGDGPVDVGAAGTLSFAPRVAVGALTVTGTLAVIGAVAPAAGAAHGASAMQVNGDVRLDELSSLEIVLSGSVRDGAVIPVLSARRVAGTFGSVSVPGYNAVAVYDRHGVAVRVSKA
jgi:autotransporter-associated beta strand protein